MDAPLARRLAAAAEAVDAELDRVLSDDPRPGEVTRPSRLLAAMRYAVLGPGKRIRPFVLIECARLFGRHGDAVVASAAALECVHAYSLVHDDLPAMDDDDLRRGRPTVHRAFDEATAILAGDGLLTIAFDILAGIDADAATRITLVSGLARAAGLGGMAGGQMLDLTAAAAPLDETGILRMQAMKTGALFAFACSAGADLGGADASARAALVAYGETLGLVFQIADDLIDATGEASVAGKNTGKDAGRGKATIVHRTRLEEARRRLDDLIASAEADLAPFGEKADILRQTVRFAGERRR